MSKQGPGTFVFDFVEYVRRRTDAPPDFLPYAALTALSAALGNRVWCDGWGRDLYPNVWSVILAPSGYRKSVALDLSQALLEKAGLGDRVLPSSFSQEALIGALETRPRGSVFYVQEFSAFLGLLSRDYNAGAMQWLTELYDVPPTYQRVLQKGPVTLVRPCVSILGASSPEWFAESFKASQLRGGFLARFLFCPSRTAGAYVGYPGPRDEAIEAPLALHLKMVSELSGRADMRAIRPRFESWDREVAASRSTWPPEFSGLRSRLGALALKCTLLFHVSDEPDNLVVHVDDLNNAIAFVEASQQRAETYLSEEVAYDRDDGDRLRVLEIVRRDTGRVQWARALKASHLDARKFRSAIETLVDSDRIRLERLDGCQWIVERVPLRAVSTNGAVRA